MQLIIVASHMVMLVSSRCENSFFDLIYVLTFLTYVHVCFTMEAGLGIPDSNAWNIIEALAEKNNLELKQLVSHYQLCLNLVL